MAPRLRAWLGSICPAGHRPHRRIGLVFPLLWPGSHHRPAGAVAPHGGPRPRVVRLTDPRVLPGLGPAATGFAAVYPPRCPLGPHALLWPLVPKPVLAQPKPGRPSVHPRGAGPLCPRSPTGNRSGPQRRLPLRRRRTEQPGAAQRRGPSRRHRHRPGRPDRAADVRANSIRRRAGARPHRTGLRQPDPEFTWQARPAATHPTCPGGLRGRLQPGRGPQNSHPGCPQAAKVTPIMEAQGTKDPDPDRSRRPRAAPWPIACSAGSGRDYF